MRDFVGAFVVSFTISSVVLWGIILTMNAVKS